MNRIYEIREGRPFWKLRPIMLLITVVALVLMAAVLAACSSCPVRWRESIGNVIGLGDAALTVWEHRQVAGAGADRGADRRDALLRHAQREAAEVPLDLRRRARRDRRVGARLGRASRFYVANFSSATTRPTARWPASSSPCCSCGSPTSRCSSAPRSTPSSSAAASCRPGSPAEEELQLPARDTRNIRKAEKKEAEDIARGRRDPRAARRHARPACTPHREEDHR